jgi:hypothetical protein
VHERNPVPDGVGQRPCVAVGPLPAEESAERRGGERSLFDERATGGDDLVDVEAGEIPPMRTAGELAIQHRLHERPQHQAIVRGHEVNRRAHQRHAHHVSVDQQLPELLGAEVLKSRPEADVRRSR